MRVWDEHVERAQARYRDGEARLPVDGDERQRQLTRMGNAAYAAGLSLLMSGRRDDAAEWLARAAERYRESMETAPPGSWGRYIAAMKCRVLAGDWAGAEREARWALDGGSALSESPIARYAAALAFLVVDEPDQARVCADEIRTRDDFPGDVGDALAFIAAEDVVGYVDAVESVLRSFETREAYLEDVPVADTVIVLQAIAARRNMAAELSSDLLPG